MFHSNHGHTVSEINGNFSQRSQNFPTPVYFATLLKGLPLELGTGTWDENTRVMGLPTKKEVWW